MVAYEEAQIKINVMCLETHDEVDLNFEREAEDVVRYRNRLSEIDSWDSFKAYEKVKR